MRVDSLETTAESKRERERKKSHTQNDTIRGPLAGPNLIVAFGVAEVLLRNGFRFRSLRHTGKFRPGHDVKRQNKTRKTKRPTDG